MTVPDAMGKTTEGGPSFAEKSQAVLQALNAPKYDWRTVRGISLETGLDAAEVIDILAQLSEDDQVVKSNVPSKEGVDLYTARQRFREKGKFGEKLLGAIRNRAV